MNSSTGDFTEIKKSCVTEELYKRATQSCVKSKAHCPKKYIMPLRPLNLAVIKKELEESWDEPLTDCSEEQKENDNGNTHSEGTTVSAMNDVCRKNLCEVSEKSPIRDKCNSTGLSQYNMSEVLNEQQINDAQHDIKYNANLSTILEEKDDKLTKPKKKNDSFDLDFSILSLQTPVKNNISNTTMKTEHANKQFEFLTPKVNITSQNGLSKNTYFKTPVNPITNSLKMSGTRARAVTNTPISQKISFKLPFDEVNNKSDENIESISPSLSNDIFNKIKVNNVEYIVFNLLGKGGSSEVFHCYNVENKCHVAIKSVSLQNSTTAKSYINEVKSLQRLQTCEKIIKMYDYEVVQSQMKLLVVLEKGGEDLSMILKRLASQQSHLPMYMLLFYWMEMLYAVKQIHSHGIIHSDLKPANFLKADGGLKLIDFGIASSVQTDMTSVIKSVPEGSCNYISPEALNNDPAANVENKHAKYKLHYKSDVWSLGCILYQLVYRRTPFQHISQLWSKLAAIMNPDYKIDYPNADWVSSKIIRTIQKCLQHNVKLRPSVDELVAEYENILNNI